MPVFLSYLRITDGLFFLTRGRWLYLWSFFVLFMFFSSCHNLKRIRNRGQWFGTHLILFHADIFSRPIVCSLCYFRLWKCSLTNVHRTVCIRRHYFRILAEVPEKKKKRKWKCRRYYPAYSSYPFIIVRIYFTAGRKLWEHTWKQISISSHLFEINYYSKDLQRDPLLNKNKRIKKNISLSWRCRKKIDDNILYLLQKYFDQA